MRDVYTQQKGGKSWKEWKDYDETKCMEHQNWTTSTKKWRARGSG